MKINKYHVGILLGLLIVVAVAYFDIQSARSGVFGTYCDYVRGNYTQGWWGLFRMLVIGAFLIIPVSYFFLYKKDKSEAMGIFLTSYTMWTFGLADLFYFWLQGEMIPQTLPWLMGNPIISRISTALSYTTVTNISLVISVIIGGIIVFFGSKYLEKIN